MSGHFLVMPEPESNKKGKHVKRSKPRTVSAPETPPQPRPGKSENNPDSDTTPDITPRTTISRMLSEKKDNAAKESGVKRIDIKKKK